MKRLNFGRICLLIAAMVAIVGSVLYYLLDGSDKTFTWLGVVFALVGAISTMLCFTKFKMASFATTTAYCAAFGLVLRVAVPSLSDVWNKVNFVGGNAVLGCLFAGVYLLCAVLAVAACFSGTEKE